MISRGKNTYLKISSINSNLNQEETEKGRWRIKWFQRKNLSLQKSIKRYRIKVFKIQYHLETFLLDVILEYHHDDGEVGAEPRERLIITDGRLQCLFHRFLKDNRHIPCNQSSVKFYRYNVSSDSEHVDKRQYHNVLSLSDTIPFNMHQSSSFDCGNVLFWLPVNSFDKIPIKINLIGLLYNFRKILWWIYDKIFHHVLVSNIMHSRITISKSIKMVCSPLWNPL